MLIVNLGQSLLRLFLGEALDGPPPMVCVTRGCRQQLSPPHGLAHSTHQSSGQAACLPSDTIDYHPQSLNAY